MATNQMATLAALSGAGDAPGVDVKASLGNMPVAPSQVRYVPSFAKLTLLRHAWVARIQRTQGSVEHLVPVYINLCVWDGLHAGGHTA